VAEKTRVKKQRKTQDDKKTKSKAATTGNRPDWRQEKGGSCGDSATIPQVVARRSVVTGADERHLLMRATAITKREEPQKEKEFTKTPKQSKKGVNRRETTQKRQRNTITTVYRSSQRRKNKKHKGEEQEPQKVHKSDAGKKARKTLGKENMEGERTEARGKSVSEGPNTKK